MEIALQKVYLHPGELLFARVPCEVVTALGSCVAVTMFSARFRAASICHVMLAEPTSNASAAERARNPFRYAVYAIPEMVARFRALGAGPGEVECRLFGGSRQLGPDGSDPSIYNVGGANVDKVKSLLEQARFFPNEIDVGQSGCCRLKFNTATGVVECSRSPCGGNPRGAIERAAS